MDIWRTLLPTLLTRVTLLTLIWMPLVATPAVAQEPLVPTAQALLAPEPVRLGIQALGQSLELEVRDLPRSRAEAVLRNALVAANELILLSDPESPYPHSLGEVNRQHGEVVLDRRVYRLLVRSLQFCNWSTGALGPTGGHLLNAWRQHGSQGSPNGFELASLIPSAGCGNVQLLEEATTSGRIRVADKTRLEIVGFLEGEALDLAFDLLKREGVTNAFGVFGQVQRAMGPGIAGSGWLVDVPGVRGTRDPYDQIWLRDQSLAILRQDSNRQPINLRDGSRPYGYLQLAVVSELAADAQGLSFGMALLGQADGQRRLGQLNPRPSVSWLLGGGARPLEAAYRWNALSRPRTDHDLNLK